MGEELPQATHEGEVTICGIKLRVYKLDDGRTIVNADDTAALFEAFACGATLDFEESRKLADALHGLTPEKGE